MNAVHKFYVTDSIKRKHAVLVGDAGDAVEVALAELPARLREGAVLRVPLAEAGEPDWPRARVDETETLRRLAKARRVLGDLRRRDPGGDVDL